MHIRLETTDGPSYEKLRDFAFDRRSSVPLKQMPVFTVRGLSKKREGEIRLAGHPPSITFASGDGHCLIRLEQLVSFSPVKRDEELWKFKGYGRIIGGEGAAHKAWLSPEFDHYRHLQQRYSLDIEWHHYSTKTRQGLVWNLEHMASALSR
jgi:hypothetical protein